MYRIKCRGSRKKVDFSNTFQYLFTFQTVEQCSKKQERKKLMDLNFALKSSIIIFPLLRGTSCSVGDQSAYYNRCVKTCATDSCNSENDYTFQLSVLGLGVSLWTCIENCEYLCQWKTVELFQARNWAIPQFRGKWPFIRLFGMQEPASVLFSIFNFLVVFKMFIKFRKTVAKSSPYYYLWHLYSIVCLNAWFWSSVYHTRDTDFTEKMDYMSAFSMVLCSFYGMGLRYVSHTINKLTFFWTVFCGSIGINHLAYLWLYYFDYSYNMKLNCAVGGLTVVGWLVWSFINYTTHSYAWKVAAFSILIAISTLLELMDFPPIFWLIDAHALWHLTTGFITVLFYNFIIDDCKFLNETKIEKFDPESKVK